MFLSKLINKTKKRSGKWSGRSRIKILSFSSLADKKKDSIAIKFRSLGEDGLHNVIAVFEDI